jgi:hypothetical protein
MPAESRGRLDLIRRPPHNPGMNWRRLLLTLLGGVFAAALAAGAQQPGKVWRIGVFSVGSRETVPPRAFREGPQRRGYVEGQNIVLSNTDGNSELTIVSPPPQQS